MTSLLRSNVETLFAFYIHGDFLLKCYLKRLLIRSLDLQCPIVYCTCKYVYGEGNDNGSDDHGDGSDDDDHNDDDDQTLKIHTDQ